MGKQNKQRKIFFLFHSKRGWFLRLWIILYCHFWTEITDCSLLNSVKNRARSEGEFPHSCQEATLPQCSARPGPGYIFKAACNSDYHEGIFMDTRKGGQHLHYISNSRGSLKACSFVPGGITGSRIPLDLTNYSTHCCVLALNFK